MNCVETGQVPLKMYRKRKFVNLPEKLELSKTMYTLKPAYAIKGDLADTYYETTNCETQKIEDPAAWKALETRQLNILEQLKNLKNRLDGVVPDENKTTDVQKNRVGNNPPVKGVSEEIKGQDLVISCSPDRPPYSILLLKKALRDCGFNVHLSAYTHSTVKNPVQFLDQFNEDKENDRSGYDLYFTLQFKNQKDSSLKVNTLDQHPIFGESNIVRYISRLFPKNSPINYESYYSTDNVRVALIDSWLDDVETTLFGGDAKSRMNFIKKIDNTRFGGPLYLTQETIGIDDILTWSAIAQLGLGSKLCNVSVWFSNVQNWSNLCLKKES